MWFCYYLVFLFLDSINSKQISELSNNDSDTLKLVHVLFRHGARTNDVTFLYPKDPYINETYHPYGIGGLTNEGKLHEYKLGQLLRERYDDFLGPIYTPDVLYGQSSDMERTKVSLGLVLAGLFPPEGQLIWNPDLYWQPIPYHFLPFYGDGIILGVYCPNYLKPYKEYGKSKNVQEEYAKYRETFDYLTENTGLNVTSFFQTYSIYLSLVAEDEWGFQLPEWTKKVYPEELRKLAIKQYSIFTGNIELTQFVTGGLLKKIINDTKSKIEGKLEPQTRKLFLYSGHELTIANFLITLDIFEPHIPPYGACIMIEVHKHQNEYGIMIFYEDYTGSEPKLLKLPACDEFCPIDQFINLLEEYIPDKNICYN